MPFHLWPDRPTRREFLGGLAVGGASVALMGADSPDTSPWIALVADTHIAADPLRMARGQTMAANLVAVVKDILAAPNKPKALVIDGDLALLDGQSGDYATLLATIEPIRKSGVPIHLAMGNHDERTRFRTAIQGVIPAESRVESKHVGTFEAIGHRFVILDSLDATNVAPGVLGEVQLGWVANDLDAHKDRPTVVFVHHNLKPKGEAGLVDNDALLALLKPRRWVKAVVFGHTHRWERSEVDGVHLVNLPAVGYPFAIDQPVGYARLRVIEGKASLELRTIGVDKSRDRETWMLDWRAS